MEKAYAFKNETEILQKSSSGGAFLGIADTFFKNESEGSVYGARFDDEFQVIHSSASTLTECLPFCGSKYVQSSVNGCYKEVVQNLVSGHSVLFTGTPCQIAALRSFAEKQKCNCERLYCVDIVCHGTPNAQFWMEYVRYLEKKNHGKLVRFSFRYKPRGWKGYPIYAEFSNGVKRINTLSVSTYQNLFRKNLLMKESCFRCRFPGNFRSDLTLADFWGIELCMPEVSVKGGVSLVLSHSEKGERLLAWMKEQCADKNILLQPVKDDAYLKYNHNLVESTKKPEQYQEFWNDYKIHGMEFVLKKYGGDNLTGRGKFYARRFLRDTGLLAAAKKILKKA